MSNDDITSYKREIPGQDDPNLLKKDIYAPLGQRVILTAFPRTSTPFRMLALPSFENLISFKLCVPPLEAGAVAALEAACGEAWMRWSTGDAFGEKEEKKRGRTEENLTWKRNGNVAMRMRN